MSLPMACSLNESNPVCLFIPYFSKQHVGFISVGLEHNYHLFLSQVVLIFSSSVSEVVPYLEVFQPTLCMSTKL
jgi:hypothetical protein